MPAPQANTLSKEERLCGKTTISALVSDGRWGGTAHLRYCWTAGHGTGLNRILVSVPKRNFKRAVRRNLLKRRIREAYRTQKSLLDTSGIDILFTYSNSEITDFETIRSEIAAILSKINNLAA
jgi:ribonuclease P protein component